MSSADVSGEPGSAPGAVLATLAAMRSVELAAGISEAALARRTARRAGPDLAGGDQADQARHAGARHKLALVYLGDVSLSMTDVACLLGYAEGAAFTRAFKRWTGRAPSQFRNA